MNWDNTLVIDFDNTICELRKHGQPYSEVLPKMGVKESLDKFKERGWRIVVYTASGMATYDGNLQDIYKKRYPEIMEWLLSQSIPFDELIMGKPLASYYIDDKAINFNDNWKDITDKILK